MASGQVRDADVTSARMVQIIIRSNNSAIGAPDAGSGKLHEDTENEAAPPLQRSLFRRSPLQPPFRAQSLAVGAPFPCKSARRSWTPRAAPSESRRLGLARVNGGIGS
jgi:hypothetical protein